ncbi:MAG: hypothetical protein IPF71_17155 [Rhodoferax sp.]|nr:hypothetical protein [Rhodoferax sp.]
MSSEAAIEAVLRADQITRTAPAGPVYVCLEVEMQEAPLDRTVNVPDVRRFAAPDAPVASADTLKRVVDVLRGAKFPLLLFGRGSRETVAWQNRVEFAEALGATVMTTLHNASSFPTEHRLHHLAPVGERPDAAEIETAASSRSNCVV